MSTTPLAPAARATVRLFGWAFLACLVLSLTVSVLAYRQAAGTSTERKSVTVLTPFDSLRPAVSMDVRTGRQSEGTAVAYGAVLGNILVLWVPVSLVVLALRSGRFRRAGMGA